MSSRRRAARRERVRQADEKTGLAAVELAGDVLERAVAGDDAGMLAAIEAYAKDPDVLGVALAYVARQVGIYARAAVAGMN